MNDVRTEVGPKKQTVVINFLSVTVMGDAGVQIRSSYYLTSFKDDPKGGKLPRYRSTEHRRVVSITTTCFHGEFIQAHDTGTDIQNTPQENGFA